MIWRLWRLVFGEGLQLMQRDLVERESQRLQSLLLLLLEIVE